MFFLFYYVKESQVSRRKWKCILDYLLLILFMSQTMQPYSRMNKTCILFFIWVLVTVCFHSAHCQMAYWISMMKCIWSVSESELLCVSAPDCLMSWRKFFFFLSSETSSRLHYSLVPNQRVEKRLLHSSGRCLKWRYF